MFPAILTESYLYCDSICNIFFLHLLQNLSREKLICIPHLAQSTKFENIINKRVCLCHVYGFTADAGFLITFL